jgi:hypothetical protein
LGFQYPVWISKYFAIFCYPICLWVSVISFYFISLSATIIYQLIHLGYYLQHNTMNRYIPERIKWSIVTWCDEGLGAIKIKKKLSSVFGPGRTYALSTINKICKKWREEGTIKRSRGQGAPRRARSLRNINEVLAELMKDIRIRSPHEDS